MVGGLHKYGQPRGLRHTVGKERRTDPVALSSMRVVAQGVHGEVHLLGVRLEARRDGIQPGLELA